MNGGGVDLDLGEVIATFREEAAEGLGCAETALVSLERRPDDGEAVANLFRVMHTIKGNAASLGFPALGELAHGLEDVLDRLRKGSMAVTPALVSALLRSVDVLKRLLRPGTEHEALAAEDRQLLDQLKRSGGAPASAPAPAQASAAADRWHEPRARTLRVDMGKLDRMLDLTGELAIVHGRLRQSLTRLEAAGAAAAEIQDEVDRLFAELQGTVMESRLVPVGPVFRGNVRAVRDVAVARGKQARLVIEGDEVEVDASVVDAIRDPLTHMVRNAVDHGIESPAERRAAGKDPCGRVALRALREAGSIVIQVADDGRGLDRERILARARVLGLVSEQRLADAEIDRLALQPGVSTAETVTELSGRGVGLDVVRRNVEGLRGSVAVESAPGRGTTITLRLPLTLAIITGLDVTAAGETFVLPLDAVVECVELRDGGSAGADGRGVLSLRGQPLPFVRLRELFAGAGALSPRREKIVVVHTAEGPAGLAVDEVLGERQAVVKPLGRLFQGLPGVSGATILGDGRVALILDVASLLRAELARAGRRPKNAVGGPCDQPGAEGVDRC